MCVCVCIYIYIYIYLEILQCLVRANPVYTIPISKSPSQLATPVETPAKPQPSSTGFASFDRGFSSGGIFDRDRSKPSFIMIIR